jgi:hypothetical protein
MALILLNPEGRTCHHSEKEGDTCRAFKRDNTLSLKNSAGLRLGVRASQKARSSSEKRIGRTVEARFQAQSNRKMKVAVLNRKMKVAEAAKYIYHLH